MEHMQLSLGLSQIARFEACGASCTRSADADLIARSRAHNVMRPAMQRMYAEAPVLKAWARAQNCRHWSRAHASWPLVLLSSHTNSYPMSCGCPRGCSIRTNSKPESLT